MHHTKLAITNYMIMVYVHPNPLIHCPCLWMKSASESRNPKKKVQEWDGLLKKWLPEEKRFVMPHAILLQLISWVLFDLK